MRAFVLFLIFVVSGCAPTAYEQGRKAARGGVPQTANPYPDGGGTGESHEWVWGWIDESRSDFHRRHATD